MRRIVMFVLIPAAVVVTAASALALPSPKTVRSSIVAAALAQSSVRWTWSSSNLIFSSTGTADVSMHSAVKRETLRFGRVGKVEIRRVSETEYEKGDVAGLEYDLGLTHAQATHYAEQWISIPKGDPAYTLEGLTRGSVVRHDFPRGRLEVFLRKSHGTRLLVLKGRMARNPDYSSTMKVRAGSRLPVSFSGGALWLWINSRFSKWNEPVNVQAPASSIPIATVRG